MDVEAAGLRTEMEAMLGHLSSSSTAAARSAGARYFRLLMAKNVTAVVSSDLVLRLIPALLAFLDQSAPNIPRETVSDAMRALDKIISRGKTHAVIKAGGAAAFLRFARAVDGLHRRAHAFSILVDMGGHCPKCFARLSGLGFYNLLHETLEAAAAPASTSAELLPMAVHAFSDVCSALEMEEAPIPAQIVETLPHIVGLVRADGVSADVRANAVWSLAHLGEVDAHVAVIASGGLDELMALLWTEADGRVLGGAVRAIGMLVQGDDQELQAAIDAGVVPAFHAVLSKTENGSTKRELVFLLRVLMSGTGAHIGAVLAEEGLLRHLVVMCERLSGVVQSEAASVIGKAASSGTSAQRFLLVQEGCLGSLCRMLASSHVANLHHDALRDLSVFLDDQPPFLLALHRRLFRDAGLPATLQGFRKTHHRRLRRLAARLLVQHFIPNTRPAFTLTIPSLIHLQY